MSELLSAENDPNCPPWSPIFANLGVAFSIALTAIGSAIGTIKCAYGVIKISQNHPDQIFKGSIAVIMAGIVGIYGLVVAIIAGPSVNYPYHLFRSYANLAGGLSCGLCGLAAGLTIGIAGEIGIVTVAKKPEILMGEMLILIFGEVLGLYGFITAIIFNGKQAVCVPT